MKTEILEKFDSLTRLIPILYCTQDHIFSCYKIMLKIELDELETPTSTVSSNLSSTGSNSIDVIEGSSSIRVAGAKRRLPFTNHDQHCPVKRSRGPYLAEFDLLNKDWFVFTDCIIGSFFVFLTESWFFTLDWVIGVMSFIYHLKVKIWSWLGFHFQKPNKSFSQWQPRRQRKGKVNK